MKVNDICTKIESKPYCQTIQNSRIYDINRFTINCHVVLVVINLGQKLYTVDCSIAALACISRHKNFLADFHTTDEFASLLLK